jgi:hypothetical protein
MKENLKKKKSSIIRLYLLSCQSKCLYISFLFKFLRKILIHESTEVEYQKKIEEKIFEIEKLQIVINDL